MSLNIIIRYSLHCDKCFSLYSSSVVGVKFANLKVLVSHAISDGWDISSSSNGRSYDCVCPDCKRKDNSK